MIMHTFITLEQEYYYMMLKGYYDITYIHYFRARLLLLLESKILHTFITLEQEY